jgi:murein DD-endopeptidase MepM/ murein hydrolase activator NlpD
VSHSVPRHRKLPESPDTELQEQARHRKARHASTSDRRPGRTGVIVGVVAATGAMAVAALVFVTALGGHATGSDQAAADRAADALGGTVGSAAVHALQNPKAEVASSSPLNTAPAKGTAAKSAAPKPHASAAASRSSSTPNSATKTTTAATTSVYLNPLRKISGMLAERVDMGVDFGGSGPIYAVGDGVITNATGDSPGWPGGGWITYQLTDGPASGLVVYVAEDVTPTVQVGQHVTPNTVIANMYNGSAGIETGWAMADSSSAESQLPAAGGISGNGPFPTAVGMNFEHLLEALGVPESPFNGSATPYGLVPSGYPLNYSSLKS